LSVFKLQYEIGNVGIEAMTGLEFKQLQQERSDWAAIYEGTKVVRQLVKIS